MSNKRTVAKFGGSSLKDAAAIRQSAKVAIDRNVSLVIVSATGGTTNQLIELADMLIKTPAVEAVRIVEEMKVRHLKIADELDLQPARKEELEALFVRLNELTLSLVGKDYSAVLKEIYPSTRHIYRQRIKDIQNVLDFDLSDNPALKRQSKQIYDHILSNGEQMSSILLAGAMEKAGRQTEIIDARKIISTDENHKYANPDEQKIKKQAEKILIPRFAEGKLLISQGFVGRAPDGSTTTLGRGGSDYSAALFAEAVNAKELQIWSDVAVASADPRIVKDVKHVASLTFQEAAELATSGAKILYSKTITPMRRANIPVYVGNTFKPKEPGTRIEKTNSRKPLVTAVVVKPGQSVVTLTTELMAQQFGYMARVFNVFAQNKVSVDQVSTSEISIAFTLDNGLSGQDKLLADLERLGEVSVEDGFSIVSLIGNDINNTPGLVSKIFSCLETKDSKIAIRMISQGASKHNFCFLVADKHGRESVIRLHKQFIEEA
ncbi:MAG TPA: aspartate kinase [Candidatus Saccharimonadales bacterium]|nr:aspartate kinase [Candidatus Saccharimonadales bacterium]